MHAVVASAPLRLDGLNPMWGRVNLKRSGDARCEWLLPINVAFFDAAYGVGRGRRREAAC